MSDNPQLDEDDIEDIFSTREDIVAGRQVRLDVEYVAATSIDEFTDEPIGSTETASISGVVYVMSDEDELLRQGGKARAGDLAASFLYDDAVAMGLDRLRDGIVTYPAPSGVRYVVDVLVEEGLGTRNRVEVALVRE